ncbi:aldo/keto reductase [Marisediminicola sp. LYQ134]|uniref:aldo/keto reductase n=1 Tax=Marisediminicola sp. LYQ134 TaxID=3391061 RepID=UPI003983B7E1
MPSLELNDGHRIPAVGLGTAGMRREAGVQAIVSALRGGYRLLDTALRYRNEREVGEALAASGVPRDEVVVTTKLRGRHHGADAARRGLELSLANLDLDRIDLYLIHWPLPRIDRYVEAWRSMIAMRDEGLIRSIGVSNFTPTHLDRLERETGVVPAVNQVELHPHLPQRGQREYHAAHGIVTESWSPLGRGRVLRDHPVITDIAARHGVTPTQTVLRWHHELGSVVIPKSRNPQRQRENLDLFAFSLDDDEVAAISALETGRRLWWSNPDRHHEF